MAQFNNATNTRPSTLLSTSLSLMQQKHAIIKTEANGSSDIIMAIAIVNLLSLLRLFSLLYLFMPIQFRLLSTNQMKKYCKWLTQKEK